MIINSANKPFGTLSNGKKGFDKSAKHQMFRICAIICILQVNFILQELLKKYPEF